MAAYETTEISPKYHKAISDWQKRNFPELGTLEKNWSKYFGKQTPSSSSPSDVCRQFWGRRDLRVTPRRRVWLLV